MPKLNDNLYWYNFQSLPPVKTEIAHRHFKGNISNQVFKRQCTAHQACAIHHYF